MRGHHGHASPRQEDWFEPDLRVRRLGVLAIGLILIATIARAKAAPYSLAIPSVPVASNGECRAVGSAGPLLDR